ncbi:MAG: hypothetical protein B6244_13340 [Candidatus Cloacimonetes bacterium 4572_55]|nr:MAG: hypothetical protein B6244_13340 [Candidatus Cloacimonetes bacterium 4572_55]
MSYTKFSNAIYNERGTALVVVVLMTLVLMTLATTNVMMTKFEMQHAQINVATQQVFEAAKAGAAYSVGQVRQVAQAGYLPSSEDLAGIQMPEGLMKDYTYYSNEDWSQEGLAVVATSDSESLMVIIEGNYKGLLAISRPYRTITRVKGQQNERSLLYQEFYVNYIPIFQFASFYDKDWELHPGKPMSFGGRIQVNGNAYVKPKGEPVRLFNLTGENIMTVAGRFYNANHPTGETNGGDYQHGYTYYLKNGGDPTQPVTDVANWVQGIGTPAADENNSEGGTWWTSHIHDQDSPPGFSNYLTGLDESRMGLYSSYGPANDPEGEFSLIKDRAHGVVPLNLPLDADVDNLELVKRGLADDSISLKANRLYWQAALKLETMPRSEIYFPDTTYAIDRYGVKYRLAHDEDLVTREEFIYHVESDEEVSTESSETETFVDFPEAMVPHKELPGRTQASVWRMPNFIPTEVPEEPVINDTLDFYYERVDESDEISSGARFVVIEAEVFHAQSSGGSDDWELDSTTAGDWYGAGFMKAGNGSGDTYNVAGNGSEMEYQVYFNTTGTWYIWTYGKGTGTEDNEYHLGLNNSSQNFGSAHTENLLLADSGEFGWENDIESSSNKAALTVTTAGLNTINVWIKEDGACIDQIILVHENDVNGDAFGADWDPDPINFIYLEAEDFDSQSGTDGPWLVSNGSVADYPTEFKGTGFIYPGTGSEYIRDSHIDGTTPEVTYLVDFPRAGIWTVAMRNWGEDGDNDKIHFGLDGAPTSGSDYYYKGLDCYDDDADVDFRWRFRHTSAAGGHRFSRINVPTAGEHEFKIFVAERDDNGVAVDQILLVYGDYLDAINTDGNDSPGIIDDSDVTRLFGETTPDLNENPSLGEVKNIHRTPTLMARDYFKKNPDPEKPYIVIEAENYHHAVKRNDTQWIETDERVSSSYTDYSGMDFMIADGSNYTGSDYMENSAELIYYVYFDQAGTWQVWNRGDRDGANYCHFGIDYTAPSSGYKASIGNGMWTWENGTQGSGDAEITISHPGVHTFHVWHAGNGTAIDQIVLVAPGETLEPTDDSSYSMTHNADPHDWSKEVGAGWNPNDGSSDFYVWSHDFEIGTVRLGGNDLDEIDDCTHQHYATFIKPRDPAHAVHIENIRFDNPQIGCETGNPNLYRTPEVDSLIVNGDLVYSDGSRTWTSLGLLENASYIRLANRDGYTKFNHYIKFDVDVPVTVYVAWTREHEHEEVADNNWIAQGTVIGGGGGVSGFAGYADFWDDDGEIWMALTNINTENFLKDSLFTTFTNNGSLPSGIEIPQSLIFNNSERVTHYIQYAWTLTDRSTVAEWEVDTLRTVPRTETENMDKVFVPVIDVLRDPPSYPENAEKQFDPFGVWVGDFRSDYLNENLSSFPVKRTANGRIKETNSNRITMCHVPPGNPDNPQTLSIAYPAYLSGHSHDQHPMDHYGSCENESYDMANNFLSGVRIYNGDRLRDWMVDDLGVASENAGLSFISENWVYVQGNYNTNGPQYGSSDYFEDTLPDGSINPHRPRAENLMQDLPERLPCAVMANAVKLLSVEYGVDSSNPDRGWLDANSYIGNYTTRDALETTFCFAVISGNRASDSGSMSGGVHNLCRYLQRWYEIDHNWLTSMVCLYEGTGLNPQGGGSYYSPPDRNWGFDQSYLNAHGWPPLTPLVRDTAEGPWVFDRAMEY